MPVREFFYNDATDLKLQIPCVKASSTLQMTQFDRELQSTWKDHMNAGHFRYTLDKPECRVLEGDHGYIAQFQPNRASNRRPPQAMLHLEQPFSADKFHFGKIDTDKEAIFDLKSISGMPSSTAKNLVVINVSPYELASSLLIPRLEDCLPQVLTLDSIELAIKAVMLSGVRNFKAAFNSLCAYASVNHLHWHLYYLQDHSVKLETVQTKHFTGDCHILDQDDYPAVGFAFQVLSTSKEEISRIAGSLFKITTYLTKSNIGHNVYITRGTRFGTTSTHVRSYDAIRIFVWAREKIVGSKEPGAFVMAALELSGQEMRYTTDRSRNIKYLDRNVMRLRA